mmetsp:Transcript_105800/g.182481  ORF Transcript_105800/g.182481 Transcript_105800/m.182481 type:complete len:736 (-) Transcript_105800:519-2726(-)
MEELNILVEHVQQQEDLIAQLTSIVEQQAIALHALREKKDVVSSEGQKLMIDDDDDDELGQSTIWGRGDKVEKDPELDDDEKKEPDVEFTEAEPSEEERNFMSVKPWLGAMAPPTNFKKDPALDEAPKIKLELEHVYGYRARTCRNNVCWINGNTIVYFAACVGIVHNIVNNTQKFFFGHTDDIVSIDLHKQRGLVATGQIGKSPKICVWDVNTQTLVQEFAGYHQRAVVSVAFSADGSLLASVGLDDDHSIAVYDVTKGEMAAESKGDDQRILSVIWNSSQGCDPNRHFITVGRKHVQFWDLSGGLSYQKGLFGNKGEIQTCLTAACVEDYVAVGTADGSIYFFRENQLAKVVQAHSGMVYCLMRSGSALYSGGRDGLCIEWSLSGQKKSTFNLNKHDQSSVQNSVRAIDVCGDKLVVGTITSTIYQVDLRSGSITPLQIGHFGNLKSGSSQDYGELWGLCPIPRQHSFATVCADGTLRIWDVAGRKQWKRFEMESPALCCNVSANGDYLAVGFDDGSFAVFDTHDYRQVLRKRNRKRRIICVKFSPDNSLLAVASAQNVVDIYDVGRSFRRCGTCAGHSSAVLHVDWDKASNYIQTTSQAYELLFYEKNGEHEPSSRRLKDLEYATQECTLGWNVQGIWPKYSDGSDVNMVNISNSEKYLVSCEDSGLVKLYNFPCIGSGLDRRGKLRRRPESQRAHGHSSHVTNAAFLYDDSYVISTGGADLCSFQWKVVEA